MEIKILGRTDLEQFVTKNPKQYDVVYYTHSDSPPIALIQNNAIEALHMPIDDIDHYEVKVHQPPTVQSVKKFLEFGKGRKKLLVACAAGISRSSSTAYLIAAQELGADKALSYLQPTHHWPNRLNVFIGARLLENPDIWNKYVKWSRDWNGHDPSVGGRWPLSSMILKMGFDKA